MCKKIICAVLTLVLVLSLVPASAIPASAASDKCGKNLTWSYDSGILTIKGSGATYNYPSSADLPWKDHLDSIHRVVFIGGPFAFGSNVFPDNTYTVLEEVSVSSLSNWAQSSFNSQNLLSLTTRPNLYTCDKDGKTLAGTKDLVIPSGTKQINTGAFTGGSFKTVKIPGSVKIIGEQAFQNCRDLVSAEIANGVETIHYGAFAGTNLAKVTLPESVKNIGGSVFANCQNLESASFGSKIEDLPTYTFKGCTSLTSVKLPSKLKVVGGGAFSDCTSLASINLPKTVTTLSSLAFENCTSLKRLNIPASVNYIAGDMCQGSAVESIHTANIGRWCWITFDGGNPLQTIHKLYEGENLIVDLKIPEHTTEIRPYAFAGVTALESVSLPPQMTRIGENAFLGCPNIKDVYVSRKEQWDDLKAKKLPGNDSLFGLSDDHVHFVYPDGKPVTPGELNGPEAPVSEKLVDMVASMVPFKSTAYKISDGRYRIGYGTPANKDDVISQTDAKNVLRKYLAMAHYKVNETHGSLATSEREALAAFCFLNDFYDLMSANELNQAIVDPASVDFMGALVDLTRNPANLNYTLCLANLFMTGHYSSEIPADYAYVRLDPNGGTPAAAGTAQGYYLSKSTSIDAKYVPSRLGYEFVGWYTNTKGGNLVTTLDSTTRFKTLYAHWQAHDEGTSGDDIVGKPVSYLIPAYLSIIHDSSDRISVFANPKSETIVNTLDVSAIVEITHEYRNPFTNELWLHVKGSGWINMGTYSTPVEPGVVTLKPAQRLNVFEEKNFHSAVIGSLRDGDPVTVIQRETVGDINWGYTVFLNRANMKNSVGWIDLAHVDFSGTINGGDGNKPPVPENPDSPTGKPAISTGVIVNCDRLNVRAEPNVYGKFFCKLPRGTNVNIYDKTTTNGVGWALLDEGWASMQYIQENASANPEENKKPSVSGEAGSDDNTVALAKGQVIGNVLLAVRGEPGPHSKFIDFLHSGARFSIFQTKMYNGVQWGRMEKGWVCMSYVQLDGDAVIKGEDPKPNTPSKLGQGRVVNCNTHVNVRASATASSALQGTFPLGNIIELLEETTHAGHTWYRTTKGWVCGDYVEKVAAVTPSNPVNPGTPVVPGTPSTVMTGIVSANMDVNVREAPGVYNKLVTTLRSGSRVNLYDSTDVNGVTWYKIDQGWMAGTYIIVSNGTVPNPGMNGGVDGSAGTTETAKGQYATATVAQSGLKARAGAGHGYNTTRTLNAGDTVTIYEQRLLDGVAWGRISNTEWVNMAFITLHSTGITGTGKVGTVIRAGHAVNIRNSPSTEGARMVTILVGAPVEILEVQDKGTESWGRTPQGWINMYYVNVQEIPAPPIPTPTPTPNPNPSQPEQTKPVDQGIPFNMAGTMTTDSLLRMVPGVLGDYDAMILSGKEIQIKKLETVDGMLWGLIDGGWVDMAHVQVGTFVVSDSAQLVFENASNVRVIGALNKGEMAKITELQMDNAKKVWGNIGIGWIELTSITKPESFNKNFMVKARVAVAGVVIHTAPGPETPEAEKLAIDTPVNVIGLEKDIDGYLWANIGSGWVRKDELTVNTPVKVNARVLVVWGDQNKSNAVDVMNQGDSGLTVVDLALALDGTPMGLLSTGNWVEVSGITAI